MIKVKSLLTTSAHIDRDINEALYNLREQGATKIKDIKITPCDTKLLVLIVYSISDNSLK